MMPRPIYVGVGECRCGRIDVSLYQLPNVPLTDPLMCPLCLADHGVLVPRARTAEDLEVINGEPCWREEGTDQSLQVECLDLGHGHEFVAVLGAEDRLMGWLHAHPDRRDPTIACRSFCAVRMIDGAPVHVITSADPLTLTPSLLCRICGAHGNVINGKWEPL